LITRHTGWDVLLDELMKKTLEDYNSEPTGLGGIQHERTYLYYHINRFRCTIADIMTILEERFDKNARVLDISAFYGFVAVALSKLGYNLNVTDLPAVFNCHGLSTKLIKNGIHFKPSDLVDILPYPESSFELVSCCETLEHLNFNPLVVLKHIHDILIPGGVLYLTVPNVSRLYNIVKHIKGQTDDVFMNMFSIQNADGTFPIQSSGVHWHEYASKEICMALECAGFRVQEINYREHFDNYGVVKSFINKLIIKCFPHFAETIVVVALKA